MSHGCVWKCSCLLQRCGQNRGPPVVFCRPHAQHNHMHTTTLPNHQQRTCWQHTQPPAQLFQHMFVMMYQDQTSCGCCKPCLVCCCGLLAGRNKVLAWCCMAMLQVLPAQAARQPDSMCWCLAVGAAVSVFVSPHMHATATHAPFSHPCPFRHCLVATTLAPVPALYVRCQATSW
jgi:hypothetical protein